MDYNQLIEIITTIKIKKIKQNHIIYHKILMFNIPNISQELTYLLELMDQINYLFLMIYTILSLILQFTKQLDMKINKFY